jgi:hypothetical protein
MTSFNFNHYLIPNIATLGVRSTTHKFLGDTNFQSYNTPKWRELFPKTSPHTKKENRGLSKKVDLGTSADHSDDGQRFQGKGSQAGHEGELS